MKPTKLLFAVIVLQWWGPLVRADDVGNFVDLFNKGKVEEIKKTTRGLVDPRLLSSHNDLVKPIKIIPHTSVQRAVDNFYDDLVAAEGKNGKKLREADLKDFRAYQACLKIAWKQTIDVAKQEGIEVKTAQYRVKRLIDPQVCIMVFFTSKAGIVLVTSLDELAEEVDTKDGGSKIAKALSRTLRFLKNAIKQKNPPDKK